MIPTKKQSTRPFTLCHPADQGGCGHYRILWPVTTLIGQKKMRAVVSEKLLREEELKALKPEVGILQRQYYDYQLQSMRMYRKHIPFMVYELDDILDKVPAWSIHKHQMPQNIVAQMKTAFGLVDRITTTTPFLANELRRFNKNVDIHVVPNYLPPAWKLLKPYNRHERIRIGWAGALAHKHDLQLLLPIMEHFKDRVDWVFMGLTPEKIPDGVKFQVVQGVQLMDYPMVLNSMDLDVGVVPLEVNTLNRCKSGIRVMEMGINGCAIVATDLEPYQGFKNIVRVRNEPQQWIDALEGYVQNRELAWKDGAALRQEVLDNHMLENNVDKYATAWGGDVYEPIAPRSSETTTIVIPVQKNAAATEACFESVIKSQAENKTPTDIVVVQDAAEGEVHNVVAKFRSHFREVLNHNTVQGFSNSVNDGMKLSTGNVVLLNSDCVVHGDWLDRMNHALVHNPQVASVTPLGTDESFVSVALPNVSSDKLDEAAGRLFKESGVEIGTPVGFCMLIRREALRDVGLFDNKAFPRIYGEENDWGCSALLFGWKHLLAASTVVGHLGNQTIPSEQNKQLRQAGLNTVLMRYSFYQQLMQNIEPIQLRQFKSTLEAELTFSGKPSIVVIGHNAGGGLETYVQRIGAEIMKEGWETFVVRPNSQNQMFLALTRGGQDFKFPEPISVMDGVGLDTFVRFLKRVNCKLLVVNTLVQYPYWMDRFLMSAAKEAGVPYDVVVHDMYYWCPQLNMVYKGTKQPALQEKFCNANGTSICQGCTHHGTMFGFVDIDDWRNKYGKFLDGARHIHVTSSIFVNLMLNYVTQAATWSPDKFKVHAHAEPELTYKQTPGPNVAVIGHNILPMKGSLILQKLTKLLPNVKFMVFGNLQPPFGAPNIVMAGRYQNLNELHARATATGCSVSLCLSTVPEIHMYSLTDSMQCGMAPAVFDLGAQAQRVREFQKIIGPDFGAVFPLDYMYLEQNVVTLAAEIQKLIKRSNDPAHLAKTYKIPAVHYKHVSDYFGLTDATHQQERLEPPKG